jgi:phosphopantothenoylcysteine decarboxylase / phosphopantothenate---cysteine ligase
LTPPPGVDLIAVESANDMYDAVMARASGHDIFVACAAVSDYRVEAVAEHKIKKSGDALSLELTPNRDILASVSALESRPFCVGFAAETEQVETYALGKLEKKKLDMIAANQVGTDASGFEIDFNQLEVFWPGGHQRIARASKPEIAKRLTDLIAERYTTGRS